jgi:hypothetical protein
VAANFNGDRLVGGYDKYTRGTQEGTPYFDVVGRLGDIWNKRNHRTFQQKKAFSHLSSCQNQERGKALISGSESLHNWP